MASRMAIANGPDGRSGWTTAGPATATPPIPAAISVVPTTRARRTTGRIRSIRRTRRGRVTTTTTAGPDPSGRPPPTPGRRSSTARPGATSSACVVARSMANRRRAGRARPLWAVASTPAWARAWVRNRSRMAIASRLGRSIRSGAWSKAGCGRGRRWITPARARPAARAMAARAVDSGCSSARPGPSVRNRRDRRGLRRGTRMSPDGRLALARGWSQASRHMTGCVRF